MSFFLLRATDELEEGQRFRLLVTFVGRILENKVQILQRPRTAFRGSMGGFSRFLLFFLIVSPQPDRADLFPNELILSYVPQHGLNNNLFCLGKCWNKL